MEIVTGVVGNVMSVAETALDFITGNALMLIPIGAAVLAIGIRTIKKFLPGM